MTIVPSPVPTPAPASNAFKAVVRSLMPFAYSGAAALIARFGYHVANTTVIQIVTIAGGALTIVLHALETQFSWIGVFLGYIGAPVYAASTKVSTKAEVATLMAQVAVLTAQLEEQKTPSVPTFVAPVTTAGGGVTGNVAGGYGTITPVA